MSIPKPMDFNPILLAKQLLRTVNVGALATLDHASSQPFASLVTVASAIDGSPLMLLSDLARHSQNIANNPKVSLLLAAAGRGDPMAHPRLTVLGRAIRTPDPMLRERFLLRHPKARLYAGFSDFALVRIQVESGHLNGGFARAAQLSAEDMLTSVSPALDAAQIDVIGRWNNRHQQGLKTLVANGLKRKGQWRLVGLDAEGCDFGQGGEIARLTFPTPVATPAQWTAALASLLVPDAGKQNP